MAEVCPNEDCAGCNPGGGLPPSRCQSPTFEDQPVEVLRADLEVFLTSAKDCADALAKQAPSRSLSLTITKIEEAEMWSLRLDETGKEVTV